MPSYKLSYFNGRGRAEVARYMFKMKKVDFEDHRIEGTWKEEKPNTPFGALPVMVVDGVSICQSSAIERLLAKRFNMYGSDDIQQAKSDMIVGCMEDILQTMFKSTQGSDEEKAEKKKKLVEEQLPAMFGNLEKMMNNDGLFITSEVMWADVAVAHILSFLDLKMIDVTYDLSKHAKLKALKDRVENIPEIAKWREERPTSTF